jgi:imidazolonepropionase-like amidohydrolase
VRALLLLAFLLASPAAAATTAIVGGTVAIGDGSAPIPNGVVVFRDGRIVDAGANVAVPQGATVIDAHGKWVSPGIVSATSKLEIGSYTYIPENNDASAPKSPFSAALDVWPALNPHDAFVAVERGGGLTRAFVTPSASRTIFAGQGAIIGLASDLPVVGRAEAFQYVELGADGARIAGGSRPAAYRELVVALEAAKPSGKSGETTRVADLGLGDTFAQADIDALTPVVTGHELLFVHIERASDIVAALSLKQKFPALRLVLVGASEGWMVADQIAAAHVPVIAESILDIATTYEELASTESNVGRMKRAGVEVAIGTIDYTPLERNLKQLASNLVAIGKVDGQTGLTWGEAFATITSKPAEIVGLGDEIGSLRPGRRADVVIWDGDPLEAGTAPTLMFIDGRPASLESHVTKLRDRYRDPVPVDLPKAYDRATGLAPQ